MKRKKRSIKEMMSLSIPRLQKHEVEEISDRVWKRLEAEMAKRDLSLRSLYGDGWSAAPLNQAEYPILMAISQLQVDDTNELGIWQKADELAGTHISAATFPVALRGLTERRLVTPQMKLTNEGERALDRARAEGKQLAGAGNEGPCAETPR
jgi:hypothetical protein